MADQEYSLSTRENPLSRETEGAGMELMPTSALEMLERAQIDVQITTAHRFPRSIAAFVRRGQEMVAVDEETAASCLYRRPVGNERGQVVYAEGESVRLAEIVAASYGNMRAYARIIEQTPRYVVAVGFAHDLESNYAVQIEKREATIKTDGTPYSERQALLIASAALSKAFRDAVFRVVPRSMCKSISRLAREVAVGDAKTLGSRRQAVMEWINKAGAEPSRVFTALGIGGIEEITLNHLEVLTGLKSSIKAGDTTIDEAFPPVAAEIVAKKPSLPSSAAKPPAITPTSKPPTPAAAFTAPATQTPPPKTEPAAAPAQTAATATEERPTDPADPALAAPAPVAVSKAAPSPQRMALINELRDALKAYPIPEAAFILYLQARGMIEEKDTLDSLSGPRLKGLIPQVSSIGDELRRMSDEANEDGNTAVNGDEMFPTE